MTPITTLLTEIKQNIAVLHSLNVSRAKTNVARLFHGRGRLFSGFEQISVDLYADIIWITLFDEYDAELVVTLKNGLLKLAENQGIAIKGVGLQRRYHKGAPSEVLFGEVPEQLVVEENGLKFQARFGRNQSTGFFLDMGEGRNWLARRAKGKRVLNLFSYTCAFSVVAIANGATEVVNLDMSSGALNTGRENHRLNNFEKVPVKYLSHDLFRSWGKLRKLGPFDIIIVDPPSYQRGSFTAEKDYLKVIRRLNDLVAVDGDVLACLNSPQHDSQFLLDLFAEYAPGQAWQARVPNPGAFKDQNEESALKVHHFIKQG